MPFDLSATLRTTMRIFASECRTKGIDLNLILGESLAALGLPMRLEADPTRLGQIFINLVRALLLPCACTDLSFPAEQRDPVHGRVPWPAQGPALSRPGRHPAVTWHVAGPSPSERRGGRGRRAYVPLLQSGACERCITLIGC